MHILVGQFIALASLFVTMFLLFMLPYCVVLHSPAAFEGAKYELVLSLANCFSAGVFVATFFVGLLPEVRELFELVIETSFPVTETVIFGGFFLALFIEQVALLYRERSDAKKKEDIHNNNNKTFTGKCKPRPENFSSGSSDECIHESELVISETEVPKDKLELGNALSPVGHDHNHTDSHSHSHEGHGHSHADFAKVIQGERGIRLFILLLSLGVHSIFEGLALGLQGNVGALFSLFLGVAVHECLVAFALGVNVARMKLSTPTTVKLALIFSASIPVGQIIGVAVGTDSSTAGQVVNAVLQGLAAGTFIHVTFMEIIPSELHGQGGHRMIKLFCLLAGFLVLLAATLILRAAGVLAHTHDKNGR